MARRTITLAALAVAIAALSVAGAWAASDSVRLSGPSRVKPGHRLTITLSATPSKATRLAVYDAPAPCARIAESELGRNGVVQVSNRAVSHPVTLRLKLPAASRGTHHACAYLFHRAYDNLITDARASLRYVAK